MNPIKILLKTLWKTMLKTMFKTMFKTMYYKVGSCKPCNVQSLPSGTTPPCTRPRSAARPTRGAAASRGGAPRARRGTRGGLRPDRGRNDFPVPAAPGRAAPRIPRPGKSAPPGCLPGGKQGFPQATRVFAWGKPGFRVKIDREMLSPSLAIPASRTRRMDSPR